MSSSSIIITSRSLNNSNPDHVEWNVCLSVFIGLWRTEQHKMKWNCHGNHCSRGTTLKQYHPSIHHTTYINYFRRLLVHSYSSPATDAGSVFFVINQSVVHERCGTAPTQSEKGLDPFSATARRACSFKGGLTHSWPDNEMGSAIDSLG